MLRLSLFFAAALAVGPTVRVLFADGFSPPAGYYASAAGLSGTALDGALNARIRGHVVRSYDQLRQDLAVTDRDWAYPASPENPTAITNILLVYSVGWSGYSQTGVWDGGTTWNREHVWPDSRGIGQPDSGPDFSDMHHLRAANPSANSSRNNRWYDLGGTLSPVTQAPLARITTDTWEPPDVDKGWISRALLYMATRYDGTETNTTDLVLVETPPSSTTGNPPQMGRKSVLLQWNRQFTPEELDNASLADDLADPDADGRANLLEFAVGGNPRASDPALTPGLQLDPANGSLRFVYRRQKDRDLARVTYVVEYADDLAGPWLTMAGGSEILLSTETTVDTVAVALSRPDFRRFWRLRISR
jgi:endonuclease I